MKRNAFFLLLGGLNGIGLGLFSLSAQAMVTSSYTLPATSSSPAISYPLPDATWGLDSFNNVVVIFNLPDDLVGGSWSPTFLMQDTPFINNSASFGGFSIKSAACTQALDKVECHISYNAQDLPLNTGVSDYLKTKYASAPSKTLSDKLDTSERFSNDPEGVLILFK
jgi:hypothetical protein